MRTIYAYICGALIFFAAVTPPAIMIMERNPKAFPGMDTSTFLPYHTSHASSAQTGCCGGI